MGVWIHRSTLALLVSCLVLFSPGCSEEDEIGPGGVGAPCSSLVPCSSGLFCLDGACFDAAQSGCKSDSDCPQELGTNYKCLSTGLCHADAECETDFDCCPPGDPTCVLVCQSYTCVGTACTAGQTEACADQCHWGERRCNLGAWTVCDAAPVLTYEICGDGIDNDCNELTDALSEGCTECDPGESVPCETPCGSGTDVCQSDGTWRGCDAPTDCTCTPGEETTEPCGVCGERAGTCSPDGTWIWSEICMESGECTPGDEELSDSTCGLCGTQRRTCLDTCAWGDWSECQEEGECSPGDEEQESCGTCGGTTRVCDSSCSWGDWSECDLSQGCSPGQVDSKSCGLCGTMTRTCNDGCEWGGFGACMDEGVCSPGMVDNQTCGNCGSQERTCTQACVWTGWGTCTGSSGCSPGDVETQDCGPTTSQGQCEQGTAQRTCSPECQWNSWGECLGAVFEGFEVCGNGIDEDCDGSDWTVPDDHEPNNSCSSCTWLGDAGEEDIEETLFGSFDNELDGVDYFCFTGTDNSPPLYCPWCSENIKVELLDQSVGMDADLHLYKGYANCENNIPLASSVTIGPDDEFIDWSETNDPDTDTYIVRVKNYEDYDCWGSYELTIKGLK